MSGAGMLARFWRILRSVSPAWAKPEDAWARSLLPLPEYVVYARMDPRDREHATRVARMLLERHPGASGPTVRAALLHDCGKQVRPYRLIERIWVGLLVRQGWRGGHHLEPSGQVRRFEKLGAVEVRALHPLIGAQLIVQAAGDARVAEIVANHHAPNDHESRLIHEVDELE